MCYRVLLSACLVLLLSASASAQSRDKPARSETDGDASQSKDTQTPPLGTPEQEMLMRNAIRFAEESHKKTLERAREGAQLAAELLRTFEHRHSFTRDDLKKLDKLEKVVRQIRNEAGGSDAAEPLEPRPSLPEAVARLADLSDKLRDDVANTPRQVVSASIIERANELIDLVRLIRKNARVN
jgi:predicted nicotinamide N-methyase